jgi:hypothetical protein
MRLVLTHDNRFNYRANFAIRSALLPGRFATEYGNVLATDF